MSAKWRILLKSIETNVPNAKRIVKCVAILHNIVIDLEGSQEVTGATSVPLFDAHLSRSRANSASSVFAKNIRNSFKDFFNGEGAVPWQNNV
ncbi:hypothetical protein FKM82_015983 [Ascaphus truei]